MAKLNKWHFIWFYILNLFSSYLITSIPLQTNTYLFFIRFIFRSSRNPDLDGTCRRQSDTQVSFSIRHSIVRTLYEDVTNSWNLCYLYYFSGFFSLGQIIGFGSCLEIHYLTLNHWLAWLILFERNWFRASVNPLIRTETWCWSTIDGKIYGQS